MLLLLPTGEHFVHRFEIALWMLSTSVRLPERIELKADP
jgi:hypothetical protein